MFFYLIIKKRYLYNWKIQARGIFSSLKIRNRELIDNAIIIISLTICSGNIILVNPPNIRIIKALIPIKRANAEITEIMIGIVLVRLRVIVNTPNTVYMMALTIPTIIIAMKNINPAIKPATIPTMASVKFPALISIPKLKRTAKDSISRNNMAKIVTVLTSSNTPTIILKVLIIFMLSLHFHFRFRENTLIFRIKYDRNL